MELLLFLEEKNSPEVEEDEKDTKTKKHKMDKNLYFIEKYV